MLATEKLIHQLRGFRFVICSWDPDAEPDDRGRSVERIDFTEAFERIRRDFLRWGHDHAPKGSTHRYLPTFNRGVRDFNTWCSETAASPKPWEGVMAALNTEDVPTSIHLERDFEKREAEAQRRKLEESVERFATSFRVKVDTVEFLEKLDAEIERNEYKHERWNDGETRAEEWAAHRYAGSTDAYFDDLNYVNSRIHSEGDKLAEAREWIRTHCPLLWLQYQNTKQQKGS